MNIFKENHFHWDFEAGYDPVTMELRDGVNGQMFDCEWMPDNIEFTPPTMQLRIDKDGTGDYCYTGGELRTQDYFHYGQFQVSMKPIKNTGVVSSFFTYTGPEDGTAWDEIDIEFLGYDTTKVQFNYFTNGVGHHEFLYDLGFDAVEAFHTYGFSWEADKITWYVDGQAVHTATDNLPSTPGKIMMNVWPGIGVEDWLQAYDGTAPLRAQYDWVDYQSAPEK